MMASLSTASSAIVDRKSAIDVLIVGNWDREEFAELLLAIPLTSSWLQASNCVDAVELLAVRDFAPELILLADPLPGTHSLEAVEQLRLAAPLARLVVVAGTWCEGELRTGSPLNGVLRLYWYELPGWWAAAMKTLSEGGCPPWSQPLDGPAAGRNLEVDQVTGLGVVAIDCKSISTFEALADALKFPAADCRWTRRGAMAQLPASVAAGIWDGGQLEPLEVERLRSFAQEIQQRGGVVIALLDFPRREHVEIARDAGCQAVFGKPFIVSELVGQIVALQ